MSSQKMSFWEVIQTVVIAFVLALIITTFIVQGFVIPTGSMETTIMPNDRVFVNKFIYRFTEPERGDIIVFKYPVDPTKDYVKRLIGLPGETIEMRNGVVYINNKPLKEPYLTQPSTGNYGPITVEKGHYFMLGDNRDNSEDSRYWGQLPAKNIKGKVFLRFWPLNRIKWLN